MLVPMFSIFTKEVAGIVKDIHNRMPVIQGKDILRDC